MAGIVRGCDKDGLTTDTIHVDTGTSLHVVQMNVAVLGDQEDHVMFVVSLVEGVKQRDQKCVNQLVTSAYILNRINNSLESISQC